MDNVGNWVFGCVIDIVYRAFLLLLVYSGTLEFADMPVVIGVDLALDILLCIARSVI